MDVFRAQTAFPPTQPSPGSRHRRAFSDTSFLGNGLQLEDLQHHAPAGQGRPYAGLAVSSLTGGTPVEEGTGMDVDKPQSSSDSDLATTVVDAEDQDGNEVGSRPWHDVHASYTGSLACSSGGGGGAAGRGGVRPSYTARPRSTSSGGAADAAGCRADEQAPHGAVDASASMAAPGRGGTRRAAGELRARKDTTKDSGGGGGSGKNSKTANGRTERELVLLDPKRVRRIMANRQSAAKSKERKQQYTEQLESALAVSTDEREEALRRLERAVQGSEHMSLYAQTCTSEMHKLQAQMSALLQQNQALLQELYGAQRAARMEPCSPAVDPDAMAARAAAMCAKIPPVPDLVAKGFADADEAVYIAQLQALVSVPVQMMEAPPGDGLLLPMLPSQPPVLPQVASAAVHPPPAAPFAPLGHMAAAPLSAHHAAPGALPNFAKQAQQGSRGASGGGALRHGLPPLPPCNPVNSSSSILDHLQQPAPHHMHHSPEAAPLAVARPMGGHRPTQSADAAFFNQAAMQSLPHDRMLMGGMSAFPTSLAPPDGPGSLSLPGPMNVAAYRQQGLAAEAAAVGGACTAPMTGFVKQEPGLLHCTSSGPGAMVTFTGRQVTTAMAPVVSDSAAAAAGPILWHQKQ